MNFLNSSGLSWKADSDDEDLSGITPMDTGTTLSDWTREPETTDKTQNSGWADFSKFSSAMSSSGVTSAQR